MVRKQQEEANTKKIRELAEQGRQTLTGTKWIGREGETNKAMPEMRKAILSLILCERTEPLPRLRGGRGMRDPICKPCPNRKACKGLCPPLQWVNGNVARKEPLLKHSIDSMKAQDYKPLLSDLIRSRQEDRIDEIRCVDDITIRAIAAMCYADISMSDIIGLMTLSRTAIYQKIRDFEKEKAAG